MKLAECESFMDDASDNIIDNTKPLLVVDAVSKQMIMPKQVITTKNLLTTSMQAKLFAAVQAVEETKKAFAITDDMRDIISEQR